MSGKPQASLLDRFSVKVTKTDTCWLWTGATNRTGYGFIWDRRAGRAATAHTISYEMFNGPLIPGLHVDHTCHNDDPSCPGGACIHRRCVNPAHLEQVSPALNIQRAAQRITTCKQGHPWTPENTRYANGVVTRRVCRACHRASERNRRIASQKEFAA